MSQITGWGPENCKIMLISDYPTKDELGHGKSLVGSSSKFLNNIFRNFGRRIDDFYRTIYVRDEIHFKKGKQKENDDYFREFIRGKFYDTILMEEIRSINPNVILCFGEHILNFLTGEKHIDKFRGSILPLCESARSFTQEKIREQIRVIPTIHPREFFKSELNQVLIQFDIARALKYENNTTDIKQDYNLWICKNASSFNEWMRRASSAEFLTVDIETHRTFITCIGFSHDGIEGVCVPLLDKTISLTDRAILWRLVSKVLRSKIPKVNQNIKYDHHCLDFWGWKLNNVIDDTMLLQHTNYPELPRGLDFLTSINTEIPYYKDEGKEFDPRLHDWSQLYYYNALDAVATWQSYVAQKEDAQGEDKQTWNFHREKVWPLYSIYKKMDDRGICIDDSVRQSLDLKYGVMLDTYVCNLRLLTGKSDINFNSPLQIKKIIYEDMKLPIKYNINAQGERVPTVDEESLEEIALNFASKEQSNIIWAVIWCRKLYKILGYINTPHHLDGRMRTSSKIQGTKSGRTSGSETVDVKFVWDGKKWKQINLGLPFQTIPKHGFEIGNEIIGNDIRRMYVPSTGFVFFEGDQGQAEARVVSVLAEDYEALEEMNRKEFERNANGLKDDLHVKTAMLVLSKGFEDITESDRQDFGKKPRHAGNYDMRGPRLALMAHISIARANDALNKFHQISPKIRGIFHTGVREIVHNRRELETPQGRKREFFGKMNDETMREAFSYIPQAVVSDKTKFDIITPCFSEPRDDAFLLSESHDSMFCEVSKNWIEEFCIKSKRFAESSISFRNGSMSRDYDLVIPWDMKTGENWLEMRSVKL